jgi:hypothetical protein
MSYTITIEHIEENVPFKDKEYKVTKKNEDGDDEYGYVYFDNTKTVITKVYEQTVDELAVSDVVAVINGAKE